MCKLFIKYKRGPMSEQLHSDIYANHMLSYIAYNVVREPNDLMGLKVAQCRLKPKYVGMKTGVYRATKIRLERLGLVSFSSTPKYTIATLLNSEVYDINIEGKNIASNIVNNTQGNLSKSDNEEVAGRLFNPSDIVNNIASDTVESSDIVNNIASDIVNNTQEESCNTDIHETSSQKNALNDTVNNTLNNIASDTPILLKNTKESYKNSKEAAAEKKDFDLNDSMNHIYQPQDLNYYTMSDGLAKLKLYLEDPLRRESFFQKAMKRPDEEDLNSFLRSFVEKALDPASKYSGKRIERFPALLTKATAWLKNHRFEKKKPKTLSYYKDNLDMFRGLKSDFTKALREAGKYSESEVDGYANLRVEDVLNNLSGVINLMVTDKNLSKLSALNDKELIKLSFLFKGTQKGKFLLSVVKDIAAKDFLRKGKYSLIEAIMSQVKYLTKTA